MKKSISLFLLLIAFAVGASVTSCRETKESKAEEAIEDVKDGVEEAGDEIEDAADDVGDEIEDMTDDH
ncbi:hypothetical protein J0X14_03885 [Muricauda sp. CAU 1633]|uniref:hypothetical protein n=1 Tax=Allomuricauda sp. CAU 1633 TaxID=2816036 RepID=UPI001A8CE4A8|nr:hypothetical protein [Muricauda sp. CAU 1633]MBO0321427.1 hypothetical protein [Muricauda sp. CAU 1633]